MRILLLQESDWITRNPHQQHHLIDRLSVRGHEIRVIDYEIDYRKKGYKIFEKRKIFRNVHKVIPGANVTVIRPSIVKIPILDYLSILYFHKKEIKRQIKEFDPDVILGFGILNSFLGVHEAKKYDIPFVYYLIDVLYRLIPENYLQFFGKILMKKIIKESDLVLAINKRLAQFAIDLGSNPRKTKVLGAGIDLSKFDLSLDGREIRKKYGIKDNELLLFFMGYLYEFSGLKELAEELCKKDVNMKLMIVGDGDIYDDLLKIANKCNKIILTGRKKYDEIPKFLAAADICVLPAHKHKIMQDIVPIKIYEYMAMAKPVIATKLPGIVMEFNKGNGVFYVNKPEETIDLARKIDIEKEGIKARRYVEKRDWEKITDKFEKILKNLLER